MTVTSDDVRSRTRLVLVVAMALLMALAVPAVGAADDICDQPSALAEPEECAPDETPAGRSTTPSPRASTDTAFAHDIGFVSDNCVNHLLNDFPGQAVIGTSVLPILGYDFSRDLGTLYGLDNVAQVLGTVDGVCGFTPIGAAVPTAGHNWSGLAVDPVTGDLYASSTDLSGSRIYSIDPTTGAATPLSTTPIAGIIDISMNCARAMYAHDISTDAIYRVDPFTGAATLLGPTGFNANFAQGMDFDNDTSELYIYLYLGGGSNVYGTVDLTTGVVTPLAVDSPLGEFEGATMTSCSARSAKQGVVSLLAGLLPASSTKVTKQIEAAIGRIEASLANNLWVDDDTLSEHGVQVFRRETRAVLMLQAVADAGVPESAAAVLALEGLAAGDRILANGAIDDAIARGGHPGRITKAQNALADGDDALTAGDHGMAMRLYRYAWANAFGA